MFYNNFLTDKETLIINFKVYLLKDGVFMKAIILYTNTGAGYVSAGKAISDALKKININPIEIDTLTFAGKSTSKKIENIYVNTVKKNPKFFGLIYKAGEKISNPKIKSIIYILNTLYSKKYIT